ncbi:DUF1800 family protein [Rhizobacter sp. AJA081-3]|uniref:DUF1800 domain-containing protein n=1 Tax=Rhizobacter sp. AJA081-3 TaxID=2753607 RepID=UPI001FD82028|nr:DUF1800 domain-containing protein [Rhizobacter sp. AJA081-3]
MAAPASLQTAAIAAHRFGLGEADLGTPGADPRGWLLAQIGPADPARGEGLLSTAQAVQHVRDETRARREARRAAPGEKPVDEKATEGYRAVILADARSRLLTAAATTRPFAERLQWFWANHFTVSLAKGSTRGLVGAFERDAIRPHIAGSFEQLLWASTTHPAMLRYLDNQQSAGPHSRAVSVAARRAQAMQEGPRVTGLNENLAREVLELHTLGVNGGYSQADVTAFAAVLTGWRVAQQGPGDAPPFDRAWHEPGRKTLLGRTHPEGPEALRAVLSDLAQHPSTARFIATKLARHMVADDPPPALVDRLAARYRRSGGQLAELYRELIDSAEAWGETPAKLKTPEEFVVSSVRLLSLGARMQESGPLPQMLAAGSTVLGQRTHSAPSPAGWPDRAEEWLGPEAVWKRIEWATRVGDRLGRQLDARALAVRSLGPRLTEATRLQIERAADGPQALALLLMSPEFQRR